MADTFVKMVEFRATGLDKIETGLRRTVVVSESAVRAASAYQKVLDQTGRAMPSMARIFETSIRQQKEQVRTLENVARAQEKVNATTQRTAMMARSQHWSGMMAGASGAFAGAAPIAGAAAAGGLAMGISGLSGTVPMARLNAQVERFTYELGNTLTPFVNILTKKLGQANNWLSNQSESSQNAIGAVLGIGGSAVAANFASKHLFGVGLGGAVSGGYGRMASLGGYKAPAGMTAAEMSYQAAYGSQGLPAGSPGIGKGMGAARGALMALGAIETGSQLYQLAQGNQPSQRYKRGELTEAEHNPLAAEYEERWKGKSDLMKKEYASAELAYLRDPSVDKDRFNREEKEFARKNDLNPSEAATQFTLDRKKREAFLKNQRDNRQGVFSDHQSNALVGGDWGEVGSGYYAAASELGKTGYDKAAGGEGGGGNMGIWQAMLDELQALRAKAEEKELK